MILKLKWLIVHFESLSWLNAYFKSREVNHTEPGTSLVIIWAAESISSWIFGIWYLFFQIWALRGLASIASLIDPSFLAVITIGLLKWSVVHLSSFVIWPSLANDFNSSVTRSWICIGTFRLLICLGINGSMKVVWTWWDLDLPSRVNNNGNFLTKWDLISSEVEFSTTFRTVFTCGGFRWTVSMPKDPWRSQQSTSFVFGN